MKMRKNSKGEFITVSFLVKIIIAVIAIFVILSFGGKIWAALFPSGDKNTIKTFNAMHSLMESMQKSRYPYDSSTLSLYIADDNRIFLFDAKDNIKCGTKTVYKPKDCEAGKNCLCLYDDEPEYTDKDRDENVARCEEFNDVFINGEYQVHHGDDCEMPDTAPFFTVIIAAMKDKSTDKKTIHIWLNTEDMKTIDKEMKKPVCPQDNTVCSLQKDGKYTTQKFYYKTIYDYGYEDMTQSEKFNAYDKTFDACNAQRNPTIIAKCNFEPTLQKCELECENPQIACGVTYKTCEDFNEKPAGSSITGYIRANTPNHFLCAENKRICNPSINCNLLKSEHYNCIPEKEDECEDFIDGSAYNGFNIVSACHIILGPYSELNPNRKNPQTVDLYDYGDIIGSYDKAVTSPRGQTYNCLAEIRKNFRSVEVQACRTDKDCLSFIMKNPAPPEKIEKLMDDCHMKVTGHNNIIFAYDYDTTTACKTGIAEYFAPLSRCSTDDVKRFYVPTTP